MLERYPELGKYSSYLDVLEKLDKKGILQHVIEYRRLRDEVQRMIDEMGGRGFNVEGQRKKLDEIRKGVLSIVPEVRRPYDFTSGLRKYIDTLKLLKKELEEKNSEAKKVEEYLERLEELRRKNEVSDEAYKRLKAEYEGKLREIKGGAETEVKAEKETETLEEGTRVKKEE